MGFAAHSAAGRERAESWLGAPAAHDLKALVSRSPDLYVVTVPDEALPMVANELARALRGLLAPEAPFVAHTSGATSVTVLSPCEAAGAEILAFHPLQTFSQPLEGSTRFAGAAVAITPSLTAETSDATAFGFALARGLRARPFLLPDDRRTLYHVAATFASNYLVAIEHHAERLFLQAGLPGEEALELFLPLVRATVDNIAARGTVAALTGPLSRGDASTVAAHIRALAASAPDLIPLYTMLGRATLGQIRKRGEVSSATLAELAGILGAADQPSALESDIQGI